MPIPAFNDAFVKNGVIQVVRAVYNSVGTFLGLQDPSTGLAVQIPFIVGQDAIPTVVAPTSTWNNTTGSLTLGTAIPSQPIGLVKIYLFASGITSTNADNIYWATFSSTTACQVFKDSAGLVQLQTTVGAYTPTIGVDIVNRQIVVAGGSMGNNGGLRIAGIYSQGNNVNNKIYAIKVTGALNPLLSRNSTTVTGVNYLRTIYNRGSQSNNFIHDPGRFVPSESEAANSTSLGINTQNNFTLLETVNLAVATDFFVFEAMTVEVLPAN